MYVTDSVRIFYGLYMALVAGFFLWFVIRIRRRSSGLTAEPPADRIDPREKAFFGILLTAVVVGHVVTLSPLVPWQQWRLWSDPQPVQRFDIAVSDYAFQLPSTPLQVQAGEFVEFNLTSQDVTYGFGVFREDGSLLFQESVLPGYENRIVWNFSEPGSYDIRSTEYGGERHNEMLVRGAILVAAGTEVDRG